VEYRCIGVPFGPELHQEDLQFISNYLNLLEIIIFTPWDFGASFGLLGITKSTCIVMFAVLGKIRGNVRVWAVWEESECRTPLEVEKMYCFCISKNPRACLEPRNSKQSNRWKHMNENVV
jgi:hypothetical protein